jgi:hypothetical protein
MCQNCVLRQVVACPGQTWNLFQLCPQHAKRAEQDHRSALASTAGARLFEGDTVHLAFGADDIHVFDATSRGRL